VGKKKNDIRKRESANLLVAFFREGNQFTEYRRFFVSVMKPGESKVVVHLFFFINKQVEFRILKKMRNEVPTWDFHD
jgi:hypothetical protein